MEIFAVILLVLVILGSIGSLAMGEFPLGGLAIAIFFVLYLMGYGN